jgi:hypothetical protein
VNAQAAAFYSRGQKELGSKQPSAVHGAPLLLGTLDTRQSHTRLVTAKENIGALLKKYWADRLKPDIQSIT